MIPCPDVSSIRNHQAQTLELESHLQLLLCIGITHASLLDHGPEGGVVEIVDVAFLA